MKLIITIVDDVEVARVRRSMIEHGFRVTLVGGSGGFFQAGSTAFLSAVEDEQVDAFVHLLNPSPATSEFSRSIPAQVDAFGQSRIVVHIFRLQRYEQI